jgi:dTDP-glucose 4,6-dehydratase
VYLGGFVANLDIWHPGFKGRTILITGGSGFIGHHAVEHFLRCTEANVVILDGLNYAASMSRLIDITCWSRMQKHARVRVLFHDIRAPFSTMLMQEIGPVTDILHFAAETHVDNSIKDASAFVDTNVKGTFNVLEYAKQLHQDGILKNYVQISTDEVYGPARTGQYHRENAPVNPSNPYAATKVAGDALAKAWYVTHGVPTIITRTMNNFGERQHPEKLIPTIMRKLSKGEKVPMYGTKHGIAYRCWLHPRNHADAIAFLLSGNVKHGQIYHIVGEEYSNLDIGKMVAECMGVKFQYELIPYYVARPGHDRRYALDGSKMERLGWKPPMTVEETIGTVVNWTMMAKNKRWLAAA